MASNFVHILNAIGVEEKFLVHFSFKSGTYRVTLLSCVLGCMELVHLLLSPAGRERRWCVISQVARKYLMGSSALQFVVITLTQVKFSNLI